MCRSSLRAAAFLFFLFAPFQHPVLSQPETAIPWLRDTGSEGNDVISPSPDPDLAARPQGSEPVDATHEGVASELAAAVIGVDRLPALGRSASPEVWKGSGREGIAEAVRQVEATPFRSANLLLRELLLTPLDAATMPLARERADALLRIGALPEALAIAHAAAAPDATILDTVTRAALLYGHGAVPCSHTALDREEITFPGLIGVFCEAVHGSPIIASVRLELERELSDIRPTEAALLDVVIHPELAEFAPRPEEGEATSDLEAGLIGHLGLPFPEGFARTAPVRQVWRLVDEDRTDSRYRLLAMARLEAAGLLDSVSFRNAILRAGPDPRDEMGVWTALLLQMADTQDPVLFGKLVEASLKLGRRQGRESMAARLIALPAGRRSPGVANAASPSVMRRIFLLANDPDTALLWLELPVAPESAMLFSIALPEFEAEWDPVEEQVLAAQFAEEGDLRAGYVLAALRAFGVAKANSSFESSDVAESPGQPVDLGPGESALFALALLADGAPTPPSLLLALRVLAEAGFEDRARQIAIEVILLGS